MHFYLLKKLKDVNLSYLQLVFLIMFDKKPKEIYFYLLRKLKDVDLSNHLSHNQLYFLEYFKFRARKIVFYSLNVLPSMSHFILIS